MSIEKLFMKLTDGNWHSINELADEAGLQTSKLTEFSKFLSQHGIVTYEHEAKKVKMEPDWARIFPPIEPENPKPQDTYATFIIPPKTTITVEATQISNLSTVPLEVEARINGNIKEIAINL